MSKYFDEKNNMFMSPKITQENSHMIMTNVHTNIKTKFINIDTRYQDRHVYENCSDNVLTVSLPEYIKNVESLKMIKAEIPFSFYNFSLQRKNTYFMINSTLITIAEGEYTYNDLITNLNSIIVTIFGSNVVEIIDDGDNKISILNNTSSEISVYFNINVDGSLDKDNNVKNKLGWSLGFREESYIIPASDSVQNESIVMINTMNYIFISVDDFNNTNPNSFLVPASKSLIDSTILARISVQNKVIGNYLIASESLGNLVSDTRSYGDKTNIQRLKIKLLDNTGNTIDLNKVDYSFCLEIKYK